MCRVLDVRVAKRMQTRFTVFFLPFVGLFPGCWVGGFKLTKETGHISVNICKTKSAYICPSFAKIIRNGTCFHQTSISFFGQDWVMLGIFVGILQLWVMLDADSPDRPAAIPST